MSAAEASRPPRIAIFGLLGSGNLGNHGSFDAMLQFLRRDHPEAQITCICSGPEELERQYGIPSTGITWYQAHGPGRSRATTILRKMFGKVADLVRMPLLFRNFDIVIIPGMGVLETTLELNAWGFPYAMLLMCVSARMAGAKVAFVSVGANVARERTIKWLFVRATRLATYRSFRDDYSRDSMRTMGLDVSRDKVYPDLAFALPAPEPRAEPHPSDERTIALGVMDYHGASADRAQAEEISAEYTAKIVEFAGHLIDDGYRIRLVTGDPSDEVVVTAVIDDLRKTRPGPAAKRLVREPAESLGELMMQLDQADVVVASRYHNVQSALALAKPTISISYGIKSDVLMEKMHLAEFRQSIRTLDVPRLVDQLRALEARSGRIETAMREQTAEYRSQLDQQFAVLSATLFGAGSSVDARGDQ
ncbi:polysaccharide pyruvyl transferase family protein [Kribbella sp. NPDC051952]|uniref:polysaccharide pyruvyl transferase family protein n=1 Tax=Kribbella sp. NPDC051952 TaxID=3154851 RepID=UPI003441B3F4